MRLLLCAKFYNMFIISLDVGNGYIENQELDSFIKQLFECLKKGASGSVSSHHFPTKGLFHVIQSCTALGLTCIICKICMVYWGLLSNVRQSFWGCR